MQIYKWMHVRDYILFCSLVSDEIWQMLPPVLKRILRTDAFIDQEGWNVCSNEGKLDPFRGRRSAGRLPTILLYRISSLYRICISIGMIFAFLPVIFNLKICNTAQRQWETIIRWVSSETNNSFPLKHKLFSYIQQLDSQYLINTKLNTNLINTKLIKLNFLG